MRPKLLITLILTLALLAAPNLPLLAAATTLSVTSAQGALGNQIDISINIENPSGLTGGSFNLYYDPDTLQPVEVQAGEVLKNNLFEPNLNYESSQGKAVRAVWAGSRGAENSGLLCTLTFKLLQNGTSPLNLEQIELFDSNLKPIQATATSGTLIAGTGQKPVTPPPADPESDTTKPGGSGTQVQPQNPTSGSDIPPFTGGKPTKAEDRYQQGKTQPRPGQQTNPSRPATNEQKPISTGEQQIKFNDTAQHWARTYIEQMAQAQIMSGYPDGNFQPDKNITRAEFTRVIALAMKLPINNQSTLNFNDRDQVGDWARPYITAAVQAGIISGYSDNTFQPSKTITRSEMAVMIARARKAQPDNSAALTFNDSAQIPDWARPSVTAAVQAGIISGKGNNNFAPLDPATRAEAACILIKTVPIS